MFLRYPNKPRELYPESIPDIDDGDSFADQKLDGWRCFFTKDTQHNMPWSQKDDLTFVSRRNKEEGGPVRLEVSDTIREIMASLSLPDKTMLDCEWLSRRTKEDGVPECLYIFDILWLEDKWMGDEKCWDRRLKLLELVKPSEHVRIPEFVESGFNEFFYKQKEIPWTEGIVVKEKGSKISASTKGCKKTALWIKVKWRSGHDGRKVVA
jgi:hypothetical protein